MLILEYLICFDYFGTSAIPIENVWGSLKRFLHSEHKPKNLAELKNGIRLFWKQMTPTVCKKYIGHVHKVMKKVIEVNGEPSGF